MRQTIRKSDNNSKSETHTYKITKVWTVNHKISEAVIENEMHKIMRLWDPNESPNPGKKTRPSFN